MKYTISIISEIIEYTFLINLFRDKNVEKV